MYKVSRQREWIYDYIQSHPDRHMSVEEIYEGLKAENREVSVATVYRNLKILQDENRIASLMLESGKQVFDKTCRPHDHLICTTCQKVFDVDMPYDRSIERKAEHQLHIPIESHSLVLYGTCVDCLQKKGKV